eukprot:EG_transcript_12698
MTMFDFYDNIDPKVPLFDADPKEVGGASISLHASPEKLLSSVEDAERDHSRDEGPVALVVESLAWYTTDASLEKVFGRYGKVQELFMFDEMPTCRSRGTAVVVFFRHADAVNAQCGLDNFVLDGMSLKVTFVGAATIIAAFENPGCRPQIQPVEQKVREELDTKTGHGMGGDYPRNTTWFHDAPLAPTRPWRRLTPDRTGKAPLPSLVENDDDFGASTRTSSAEAPSHQKPTSATATLLSATPPAHSPTVLSYGHVPMSHFSTPAPVHQAPLQQPFSYFAFHQQQQLLSGPQFQQAPSQAPASNWEHHPLHLPSVLETTYLSPAPHLLTPSAALGPALNSDPQQRHDAPRLFPRKVSKAASDNEDLTDFLVPTTDLYLARRPDSKDKRRRRSSTPEKDIGVKHHTRRRRERSRPK